jgi:hypothetical protein
MYLEKILEAGMDRQECDLTVPPIRRIENDS